MSIRISESRVFDIAIIIVLYKCKAENSKTIRSLANIAISRPELFNKLNIIIYENGKSINENINLPFEFSYICDDKNLGLATAYNFCLKAAVDSSAEWIGIFDQDTYIPINFIDVLYKGIHSLDPYSDIVALVPRMFYKNYFFSPSKVMLGGLHRPISKLFSGIAKIEISAVGSCSFLKVSFLNQINGFNLNFPIDSLDRWIFFTIFKMRKKVFVLSIDVEHELSILDYDKFMNVDRYLSIINSEKLFMDT
jgi:GT2 family glycosyltransferase